MAKQKRNKYPTHETGDTITTKSLFGSHQDMVVPLDDPSEDIKGLLPISDHQVICKDDVGYYVTDKKRLDDGLADPARYNKR
tara:strand:+ start:267 stop:512 length:246 start_codon:yes stop_codon:yes gene_type:complete